MAATPTTLVRIPYEYHTCMTGAASGVDCYACYLLRTTPAVVAAPRSTE